MQFIYLLLAGVLFVRPSSLMATETLELPHRNYILPEQVPMWPPAWWTWPTLMTLLIGAMAICILLIVRRRKNAYRREAISLFTEADDLTDAELLILCHQTIRRCLITQNKQALASLANAELFTTLDQENKSHFTFFNLGPKFITGPYQPNLQLSKQERENIINTTKHWCRRHHA